MRALVAAALVLVGGCTALVEFAPPDERGAQCTDGVDNDGNGRTDCQEPSCETACTTCGNGDVEAGEQCDDGNDDDTDACTGCRDASCGDGAVFAGTEQCDDGNNNLADACPSGPDGTCTDAICGDGFREEGVEECDDGHHDNTDGCLDGVGGGCRLGRCGDGFVEIGAEECDDGGPTPADGCEPSCAFTCGPGEIVDGRAFDPASGHCYLAYATPLAVISANDACLALGGYLAVPGDSVENDLVRAMAPAGASLGLADFDVDELYGFRLVTGDLPASYLNFTAGQPDEPLGAPICVGYDGASPTWLDHDCEATNAYVCELHASPCGDLVVQPDEVCDDGNTADDDGCSMVCDDEDECTLGADNCSADADCFNDTWSPGNPGFTCQCLPGFVGDGVTCTALPSPPTFTPSPPTTISDTLSGCTTATSHLGRKVAVDQAGFLYAVMLCPGAEADVTISTDGGATWSTPSALGTGVDEATVVGLSPGRAVVAMLRSTGEVVVRLTVDLGATWGPDRQVAVASDPAGGVSLAVDALDVLVGIRTPGGLYRVHRSVDPSLSAFVAVDTVAVITGDVLVDPSSPGVVWAAGDNAGFHLRGSTDGGNTFPSSELTPSGAYAASDWALGGGSIFVTGTGGSVGVLDATTPSTTQTIAGLPAAAAGQRAIAADLGGDAIVAQAGPSGGVTLVRLPVGGAVFDAAVPVDAAGTSPGVAILPGGLVGVILTAGAVVQFAVVDPTPPPPVAGLIHHWSFEGGSTLDTAGAADGSLYDGASVVSGRLVLDGIDDYFRTMTIDADIDDRTLVAWVALDNLTQQGGSALTLEDPTATNDVFDAIVFGEQIAEQWFVGSNFGSRSASPFGVSETVTSPSLIMLAYAYAIDGSIIAYRDGVAAAAYTPASVVLYQSGVADVLIGVRHDDTIGSVGTPGGADAFLAGAIEDARIYDHPLSPLEISALFATGPNGP